MQPRRHSIDLALGTLAEVPPVAAAFRMGVRHAVLALLAIGCSARERVASDPAPAGYRYHQNVAAVSAGADGARLQLLEDSRITPAIRSAFQRGLPDDACAGAATDSLRVFCADIARRPLRSAVVRLVDTTGSTLDTMSLERPIADIALAIPASASAPAVYGVSIDLTADAGSYSGPLVELFDLRKRKLARLQARDAASDSLVDMLLPTTMKTAWQIVPHEGSSPDILLVACRPTFEPGSVGFRITYSRFSRERGEWRRYQRTKPGIWENDGVFPPRSEFP